ncbi:MAG: hypothetical protein HZC05_02145 [Candidatus Magasanikbacteria bacterium]|nr:hypothetical protein [Candidatus Magasanikbacteria bacterium]
MTHKLSEDSRKFITSQNKKRLKSAKILCWFFTPFAILSIYASIKVAQEGGVLFLLSERGGIAGVIFVICAVFAGLYFLFCFAKLKLEIKELPEFQINIVEGVPKLKEGYYRHSFRAPATGAIYSATQQISFIGTINGVKYNLMAASPNMVGSAPMRFIAITRRSWLFLCDWKNFVVEIQELSAEEMKKYEENQLKNWPDGEYKEAILLNDQGQLSAGQTGALRKNKFKSILLWLGLLAGSILLMSISGWYLLAGDRNYSMSIVIVVLLAAPALINFFKKRRAIDSPVIYRSGKKESSGDLFRISTEWTRAGYRANNNFWR